MAIFWKSLLKKQHQGDRWTTVKMFHELFVYLSVYVCECVCVYGEKEKAFTRTDDNKVKIVETFRGFVCRVQGVPHSRVTIGVSETIRDTRNLCNLVLQQVLFINWKNLKCFRRCPDERNLCFPDLLEEIFLNGVVSFWIFKVPNFRTVALSPPFPLFFCWICFSTKRCFDQFLSWFF